jgi:hypothetical protein
MSLTEASGRFAGLGGGPGDCRQMRANGPPESRELHAVASSLKQHSAEGGFHFLETLTECGLLDAATACCAREVAFAGCGQKIGYLLR